MLHQPDSSQTSEIIICSFCGQQDNELHKCRTDSFTLLNRLAQRKRDNPFSQVENLVFQGGGVKGAAYIGALRALFDEHKIRPQVKRVAGSSAGAIAALYITLGHDTNKIATYMQTSLLGLLDENPKVTAGGEEFSVKTVFEKLLEFFGDYDKDDLIQLIRTMLSTLLKDNLGWFKGGLASWFTSKKVARLIADYVFLTPKPSDNKTIEQKVEELRKEIEQEEEAHHIKDNSEDDTIKSKTYSTSPKKEVVFDTENVFYKALADLVQQTLVAENPNFSEGWFAADIIKQKLILDPIEDAYKRINKHDLYKPDLTFGDMASVTVDGEPAFQKLYVTAFNSANGRTEIFSPDHTPNVVVADAVRASMSIPIFFKTVKIRERGTDHNLYARKTFTSDGQSKEINYMDGGILDNYAMWIFDDLQYCVGDSFAKEWIPTERIPIRNPFTLGLKLIDSNKRKLYLHPYLDIQRLQPEVLELPKDPSPARLFKAQFFADSQENVHINSGDASRTIYVDNLGVSAVAFNLNSDQIKVFENSGELAVRQYINYFNWNKLSGIGQKYIPIKRTTAPQTVEQEEL